MKLLFLGLLLLNFSGCSTSPTGRSRLLALPDGQMNQMGTQAFFEMKKTVPTETNTEIVSYVNCVTSNIIKFAEDDTGVSIWETEVFRDDSPNAFALPGGKMGVHSGLLKVAVNQNQLAAVMGHEVGHVLARHGAERMTTSLGVQLSSVALSEVISDSGSSEQKALVMAAIGLGGQFGVLLPNSRAHESEADYIGIKLMARAGFDPRESVRLWYNMGKASGGGQPPEWMSTHPSHNTRIERLQGAMPEAMKIYRSAQAQGQRPQCKPPRH